MSDCPWSRIDIIGSNGGEGLHYIKKCNHCGIEKPLIDFHVDKKRADGRKNTCASCIISEQKERHSQDYRKYLLRTARHRAKKANLPFNITEEDLKLIDTCPVLGIPLETGKHNHPNSPSIDRVNPELGYIKGNVHVISRRANTIKNNANEEELLAVAKYVRDHYSETSMNINDVNKSWKENHPEPQWTDEESSQYTVELMKKFHEELKRKEALKELVKEAQEMGLYN